MVTGEHAVVYGAPSIVCAIEQRIHVKATPLADKILDVRSEIAPPLTCPLGALPTDGAYRFVCNAVARCGAQLDHGLRLEITSQIDPTLGLGSSAAVTIATLGALTKLTGNDRGDTWQNNLHNEALTIVRHLQGRGSGADLAASLFGGMIAYQLPHTMLHGIPTTDVCADVCPLGTPPPMGLSYCGYKTRTGDVLAKIAADRIGHETEFDALFDQMGENAKHCIEFAKLNDWPDMGRLMNDYQELMKTLGVSDAKLDQIVAQAQRHHGLWAAKISGSGLGDCVLSFGDVPDGFTPVNFADTGLRFHD